MSEVRLFGIRHHGPGSAKSLLSALHEFEPDILLIEGMPEAESLLHWMRSEELEPPVALLAYAVDDLSQAVFYPWTEFSPEWVAVRWAQGRGVDVRFIDMPAVHLLAPQEVGLFAEEEPQKTPERRDPLAVIADAAGYEDGERWWEHFVEERQDPEGIFEGVAEIMQEARAQMGEPTEERELRREAFMRQGIRQAVKDGIERIAVIVGAWHVPALARWKEIKATQDAGLTKGLAKAKVQLSWVPWSYDRIAAGSGYGAGVISPAYYEHLWHATREEKASGWILRAAHLLRAEDLDASPASVIEAIRLAEALAGLRGLAAPGIQELQEAVLTVLAQGNHAPMALIQKRLIIGQRMGAVPSNMPGLPIQQDLASQQKRLRLKPEVEERILELDLREPFDLERSHLLHRLGIIGVPWGEVQEVRRKAGTFHEHWALNWEPHFALSIVEASQWGTTIESAATARVMDGLDQVKHLAEVAERVQFALTADLHDALAALLKKLEMAAAIATDVVQVLDSLPSLARALRYGSVRQTDEKSLSRVVDGLVIRAAIGLVQACRGASEESAGHLAMRVEEVTGLIAPIVHESTRHLWDQALIQVADEESVPGILSGKVTRLLRDAGLIDLEETVRRWGLVLTPGNPHLWAAAWIEGFLGESGLTLLYDEELFVLLDQWLISLKEELFDETLPLLRRTFASFASGERRQISERVIAGASAQTKTEVQLDPKRLATVAPILDQLFGGSS